MESAFERHKVAVNLKKLIDLPNPGADVLNQSDIPNYSTIKAHSHKCRFRSGLRQIRDRKFSISADQRNRLLRNLQTAMSSVNEPLNTAFG